MVERVETWVEHPVAGDLHVDTAYTNYQDFGGLKVPGKIVRKQAGLHDVRGDDHERSREPGQHHAVADASAAAARPRRRPGAAPGGSARGARGAGREAGRRRLPDHRRLCGARRRHGGSHRRARRRSERGARPGGDRGSEEGDSEQADPVPGQHARALRSRQRARAVCGRRHHDHHAREQRGLSREAARRPADAGRGRARQSEPEAQRSRAPATARSSRAAPGRSSCTTSRTSPTATAC